MRAARKALSPDENRVFKPVADPMSAETFVVFSEYIQGNLGIKMPEIKRTMLESRLLKRLRRLGINSFDEYRDFVFSEEGRRKELVHMIDAITTNKTDFFREPEHFDHLYSIVLPELLSSLGAGRKRPLAVWSAGCSTGEEPYTLGMVVNEFAETISGYRFEVLGTDISVRSLQKGASGIYAQERTAAVPEPLRKKYFMRGTGRAQGLMRIVPELRAATRFQRLNFMAADFGMTARHHVVFCRNVIIYFDKPTQEALIRKLAGAMVPGGYLFVGHSETLHGLKVPVKQVAPMVYRKASA